MEAETRMRINENGRLVIPASFRKALGINVGDEVVLRIEDDELRITTLERLPRPGTAAGAQACEAGRIPGG
jgi:AbrB family looped-hinge helix DNA binding protein